MQQRNFGMFGETDLPQEHWQQWNHYYNKAKDYQGAGKLAKHAQILIKRSDKVICGLRRKMTRKGKSKCLS